MRIIVFSIMLLLVFAGSIPVRAEKSPTVNAKAARNCPTVEIFVTSWCGYCKMMEQFLDKNGVPYTTYDVEKDDRAAKIYRELRGRGVPLVRVGSKVVYGYDPDTVLSYVNGR